MYFTKKMLDLAIVSLFAFLMLIIFHCDGDDTPTNINLGTGNDTTIDTTTDTTGNGDTITDTLSGNLIVDHTYVSHFYSIPDSIIRHIRNNFHFLYGHTSHGGQILSGAWSLQLEDTLYTRPTFYEIGDDLGYDSDTTWAPQTRTYLNAHPETDVVLWSWCGGMSYNTENGVNVYLNKFNELEQAYPGVVFVYMTGHLDGTGVAGNLYIRNNQIRDYCEVNNKVLFDFADIESYDPDGNYYPDESDACGWCVDWCTTHDCGSCSCAHSHCFNCYIKAKAFWVMVARIAGWDGT